jgi:homoserine dehydrogenase
MERVNVGLVGFGTVGGAFYRLMQSNGGLFESKFGVAAGIAAVAEKDSGKVRAAFPGARVVEDYRALTGDPAVDVIVELVGGTGVAHEVIRGALEAGKHVISANKALLALRGDELFALARQRGRELRFEGAVCGGIPIIKVVRESLVANRIDSIVGIVNGTSNFILTMMSDGGLSFAEALRQAQAAGFAEADPTLDVGGGDSAHKISLLASFAFGGWIDYRELLCEGITGITAGEIEFAASAGFVFKLLASARWNQGRPAVTVFPALVPRDHPLAFVRGEMNALMSQSDYMGPAVFVGRGAGRTAGRRDTAQFDPARRLELFPRDQLEHRYFFHFITANRPGIWAAVTTRLADNGINIESVHQKWEDRSLPSDLYVLVDEAPEARARQALAEIRAAPGIDERSCFYRILPQ